MTKSEDKLLLVLVPGVVIAIIASALLGIAGAHKGFTICDVQGCNCSVPAGGWKNINCNLLDNQELVLQPDDIPKEATEIFLTGGKSVIFKSKTFDDLRALTLLRLENIRKIVFDKKSFFNIQSSSLLLQIFGCDDLFFGNQAFDEIQGSLATEIINVKRVKLEESPFSKLSNCTFQNIDELSLESGAFEIRNLGSIGRHGPVSVVLFVNVYIPEIPKDGFRTSLAQIAFKDCQIGTIGFEAFTSAEISSVLMMNTTIDTIGTGALTERTLLVDFKITKCTIGKLQSKAIMAGMAKLTVNHSIITDIEPKAIASTTANVEIVGNQILNFHTTAILIQKWNRITIDQNIIKNLGKDFIIPSTSADIELVSFKGNEIYNLAEGSLSFLTKLDTGKVVVDDNFFNKACACDLTDWSNQLTNSTLATEQLMASSFCTVDEALSLCFSLPVGIINMQNFTEKTCNNHTVCEPYNGETRTINTTGKIFIDNDQNKNNWLLFTIVLISLLILTLIGTFVALLVRGSRWLKRKGYFRNNYYNNDRSNEEEENTIVTVDADTERLEMPEELTIDFLHELSKRLDDPTTHQEASEMIEKLYEMFIVDDSYENNNREEEAHLYEELGNLNLQIPPPPYEPPSSRAQPQSSASQNACPRGILKLMEEKFGSNAEVAKPSTEPGAVRSEMTPIFTGHYSEPIDKNEVHLYSELKQKDESKKDSVRSNGTMALRPLPDKPNYAFQAGPSTKL